MLIKRATFVGWGCFRRLKLTATETSDVYLGSLYSCNILGCEIVFKVVNVRASNPKFVTCTLLEVFSLRRVHAKQLLIRLRDLIGQHMYIYDDGLDNDNYPDDLEDINNPHFA